MVNKKSEGYIVAKLEAIALDIGELKTAQKEFLDRCDKRHSGTECRLRELEKEQNVTNNKQNVRIATISGTITIVVTALFFIMQRMIK